MSRVEPPLFYWKELFHSSRGQCISGRWSGSREAGGSEMKYEIIGTVPCVGNLCS